MRTCRSGRWRDTSQRRKKGGEEIDAKYYTELRDAKLEAQKEAKEAAVEATGNPEAPVDKQVFEKLLEKKMTGLPPKYVFDEGKYLEATEKFGVIVFECTLDIAPIMVYLAYQYRWDIEVEIDMYRNVLGADRINVHDDLRVIAMEFINTLSEIMGSKVKRRLMELGIFDKYTQPQIMKALSYIWKRNLGDGKWSTLYTNKNIIDLVKKLGIDA